MGQLLAALLRGLGRNLLVFAAIVLVLASGHWLRGEWANIQHIVAELPALRQAQAGFDARRAALEADPRWGAYRTRSLQADQVRTQHNAIFREVDFAAFAALQAP